MEYLVSSGSFEHSLASDFGTDDHGVGSFSVNAQRLLRGGHTVPSAQCQGISQSLATPF